MLGEFSLITQRETLSAPMVMFHVLEKWFVSALRCNVLLFWNMVVGARRCYTDRENVVRCKQSHASAGAPTPNAARNSQQQLNNHELVSWLFFIAAVSGGCS
jgi:hypothetical protein